jgi:hypothetical protein
MTRSARTAQRHASSTSKPQKPPARSCKSSSQHWVWTEPDRAIQLCRIYNDRYNNLVQRHFDGSYLTLPDASRIIKLYLTQKRAIARILLAGNTYLAHCVGAGKTFILAAAIMEQKRLGMISKPMLVVPAHCLAQTSCEFLQLYPAAQILVADETNFSKEKRQRFLARAATSHWDAIIITQPAFKLIAAPADFERQLIEEGIRHYEALLAAAETRSDRLTRKRLERLKEGLEDKLCVLSGRKDDMLSFAEIGADQLLIDEAHHYRKLSFPTNQSTLKGIDGDGSQMAWDLWVKSRWTEKLRPGRGLIMASGTPITNTIGEMYTLQRYMAPDMLCARGLNHFDAWAATFGDVRTELELQPSGVYKPVSRFAEFVNVPELCAMFRSFADVVQKDDLREHLKLPRIKGGQRQIVTASASAAFRAYQKHLAERIEKIQMRRGPPKPGDDILLAVITDGRHAPIDMRLVDPAQPDDPASKLNALIDNVFRIWKETGENRYARLDGQPYDKPGAGQLIFSDLGTQSVADKRGFSAYGWIRERLISLGIPESEIAFVQDYRKATAKKRLFDDFNAGLKRILLGASDNLGTGANVQRRLKALHHLDVPWMPSKIEQREGRGERQGNEHDEIEIYAYATTGSMDATMWQSNERKMRFIAAAFGGDRTVRRLEDLEGSQASQFALAKALASGDERLLRKAWTRRRHCQARAFARCPFRRPDGHSPPGLALPQPHRGRPQKHTSDRDRHQQARQDTRSGQHTRCPDDCRSKPQQSGPRRCRLHRRTAHAGPAAVQRS